MIKPDFTFTVGVCEVFKSIDELILGKLKPIKML